MAGCTLDEVVEGASPGGRLEKAVIPAGHVSASEFACRAGAPLHAVMEALGGELEPALLDSGRLDLAHPAALAFMAAHPLNGQDPPEVNGEGFLARACAGEDQIDVAHPVSVRFLARWLGRVPTDADIRGDCDPPGKPRLVRAEAMRLRRLEG